MCDQIAAQLVAFALGLQYHVLLAFTPESVLECTKVCFVHLHVFAVTHFGALRLCIIEGKWLKACDP